MKDSEMFHFEDDPYSDVPSEKIYGDDVVIKVIYEGSKYRIKNSKVDDLIRKPRETMEMLVEYVEEGKTLKEIGEMRGFTHQAVAKRLNKFVEYGLESGNR